MITLIFLSQLSIEHKQMTKDYHRKNARRGNTPIHLFKSLNADLVISFCQRYYSYLVLHHGGEQLPLQLKDGVGGEHLPDPLSVRPHPQAACQLGRHGEDGGGEGRIETSTAISAKAGQHLLRLGTLQTAAWRVQLVVTWLQRGLAQISPCSLREILHRARLWRELLVAQHPV